MNKPSKVSRVIRNIPQHWVGDGFPVRSLFSYHDGNDFDPFLLLDYAGPHRFPSSPSPRGVGEHPHRGFETVTIVYQGELEHRDSSGSHGSISAGDVQWMTAASGIVHEEFHSQAFAESGGTLEMVQLWVNLPKEFKMSNPRYQAISRSSIPVVKLADDLGKARIIAGNLLGQKGPALTHTPINLWDVQWTQGGSFALPFPAGHNCMIVVQQGSVTVDSHSLKPVELALLAADAGEVELTVSAPGRMLVLTGQPIEEPVVGQGPFVMNTREEIRQAIEDYQNGRMGSLSS